MIILTLIILVLSITILFMMGADSNSQPTPTKQHDEYEKWIEKWIDLCESRRAKMSEDQFNDLIKSIETIIEKGGC
jgi:hypothetical protein